MITFSNPLFWLQFLFFIPVVLIAFYIPGNVVLPKEKSTLFQSVILSFIVGIVLWSLQGFLVGYLHARWLSYVYLGSMIVFWIRQNKFRYLLSNMSIKHIPDPLLLLLVGLGILIQVITVWFIGYQTREGLVFCCFWPDSFYHLSLVQELVRTFPPIEPGMSMTSVKNYHYLANLVVADLVRVFRLSLIPAQYQFMPVFITSLLAGAVICIGRLITPRVSFTRWLVFFVFFSGDIIFLFLFLLGQGLNLNVTVSENATSLWFSPPRVYAMVILFGAICFFLLWFKKKQSMYGILFGILVGSLVGFKIYLGFFAISGLVCISIVQLAKKEFRSLIPLAVAGFVSLCLYLPLNANAGGLFFSGLWRIDNFAVRPEFGLLDFTLAKQVYTEHGNILRVVLIELLFFVLYIACLLGMFAIGFIQNKQSFRIFSHELHIFLLSGTILSFILGMLYLQTTGGANTSQFLFSLYIVGGFYASLSLHYWLPKLTMPFRVSLIILILLLTSGRVMRETYENISDIISQVGYYTVKPSEIDGLVYVKNELPDDAVVATDIDTANKDECYILSFIADKNFYLCGVGILEDHGILNKKRIEIISLISKEDDHKKVAQALYANNIHYMYLQKDFLFGTSQAMDYLDTVYSNDTVQVLKVKNPAPEYRK